MILLVYGCFILSNGLLNKFPGVVGVVQVEMVSQALAIPTNIGHLSNPETDPEVPSAAYYLVILFPPGLYLPFTVPSPGNQGF
jgi:hypothetical protein